MDNIIYRFITQLYFNQFIILRKNGVHSHCKKSTDNYEKPYITLRLCSVIFYFLNRKKLNYQLFWAIVQNLFLRTSNIHYDQNYLHFEKYFKQLTLCWWLNHFWEPSSPVLWGGWNWIWFDLFFIWSFLSTENYFFYQTKNYSDQFRMRFKLFYFEQTTQAICCDDVNGGHGREPQAAWTG